MLSEDPRQAPHESAEAAGRVEVFWLRIRRIMIVAAALLAQGRTLYSEDMQNGLLIGGALRIKKSFLGWQD